MNGCGEWVQLLLDIVQLSGNCNRLSWSFKYGVTYRIASFMFFITQTLIKISCQSSDRKLIHGGMGDLAIIGDIHSVCVLQFSSRVAQYPCLSMRRPLNGNLLKTFRPTSRASKRFKYFWNVKSPSVHKLISYATHTHRLARAKVFQCKRRLSHISFCYVALNCFDTGNTENIPSNKMNSEQKGVNEDQKASRSCILNTSIEVFALDKRSLCWLIQAKEHPTDNRNFHSTKLPLRFEWPRFYRCVEEKLAKQEQQQQPPPYSPILQYLIWKPENFQNRQRYELSTKRIYYYRFLLWVRPYTFVLYPCT